MGKRVIGRSMKANLEEVQTVLDPMSDFALSCYAYGVGWQG